MYTLTDKQIRFLKYISINHRYLGNRVTVDRVLKCGEYSDDDLIYLKSIISNYKELLKELRGANPAIWMNIERYGKPTKYLK